MHDTRKRYSVRSCESCIGFIWDCEFFGFNLHRYDREHLRRSLKSRSDTDLFFRHLRKRGPSREAGFQHDFYGPYCQSVRPSRGHGAGHCGKYRDRYRQSRYSQLFNHGFGSFLFRFVLHERAIEREHRCWSEYDKQSLLHRFCTGDDHRQCKRAALDGSARSNRG